MNTDFPKSTNKYLKASVFQDQEIPLTYKGWEKKANEDRTLKGQVNSWKLSLKYCLRYSYPEFAMDEAGEKRLGTDGQPFKNSNYDPAFPHGYTIVYHFDEGQLESGSLPLFEALCLVRPRPGEVITIGRSGREKETKWRVRKVNGDSLRASVGDLPEIQLNPSEEEPF